MESLEVTVYAFSDKQKELMNACRMVSEQSLEETGCVDSRFSQDSADKNLIKLKQVWEHRRLLDDYFRSHHFSALLGAIKWLGKDYEIRIYNGNKNEGLNAVENARVRQALNAAPVTEE